MRQTSRGICTLCQGVFGKSSMARHVEVCRQKVGRPEHTMQRQMQKTSVFHLVVEGERLPTYWLHLEVASSVTLEILDQFLREIWLECCGHLSAFTIDGVHYCMDEQLFDLKGWHAGKQPMQTTLAKVMRPGQISAYEYDFGSTTALRLKVVAACEVETQGMAIWILARNVLPPVPCDTCGQPATSMCLRCWYGSDEYEREEEERDGSGIEAPEREEQGYLCTTCAATHQCAKEDLRPLRRVRVSVAIAARRIPCTASRPFHARSGEHQRS